MKRILIVEDEKALRDVFSLLFKTQGYDVLEAENGKVAIDIIGASMPDIIILDILMPVMDGMEFLEKANLAKKYPDTKVLVLSNLSDQKTIDRVTRLGADQYLLKAGVSPTDLVAAVKDL